MRLAPDSDFSFREGKAIFGPPIKLILLKLYAVEPADDVPAASGTPAAPTRNNAPAPPPRGYPSGNLACTISLAGSGDRHTKFGGSDVYPSLVERIPEHDDHHLLRSRVRDLCAGDVSVSPESDIEHWL